MSEMKRDWIYNLLPRIYRIDDLQEGEPLRALLRVIEDEAQGLMEDMDGLYNDWFIETCSPWVIPYIGDLVGVKGILPISSSAWSLRSYVANAIGYRRKKGTPIVLEQLPPDITGWPCHLTEFFKALGITQNLGKLMPDKLQSPDIRNTGQIDRLSGPFVEVSHTVDIKPAGRTGDAYNISNIGLFLWRLRSYPLHGINARRVKRGCYTFDPTGLDIPLFNMPQIAVKEYQSTQESDLPCPLRRYPLREEIETICRKDHPRTSYFDNNPVFNIDLINGNGIREHILPEDIMICDLSGWQAPFDISDFKTAVDPERGRLMLSGKLSSTVKEVLVSYSYGFSTDVGAGPYDRQDWISNAMWHSADWQAGVGKDEMVDEKAHIFTSISKALDCWESSLSELDNKSGNVGLICIMDSRTYEEDLTINVPGGSQLLIIAANWPIGTDGRNRDTGIFSAKMRRPCLRGSIKITGTAAEAHSNPGELVIDGLVMDGWLTSMGGDVGSLTVAHSTIVPGRGGIRAEFAKNRADGSGNGSLRLSLYKTISGEIRLMGNVPRLSISECIVQSLEGGIAIDAEGADLSAERSTVLGRSTVRILEASNSIFADEVLLQRQQEGCVRFCYLLAGIQMVRSFRCQPSPTFCCLRPAFTSERYGDPGYAQLSQGCAMEILMGADDGAEMGVFNTLQQSKREANLRTVMEEYIPFGLDVGIFYVT
jgi:hypothetical protein